MPADSYIAYELGTTLAPTAIVELFVLELNNLQHGTNDVYRFHAGTNELGGDVIWNGQTYIRFPIEASGFSASGTGPAARPRLRASNVLSTITALLTEINLNRPGNDLTGAKVTRIRTLARYLDAANFAAGNPWANPTAEFPRDIYFVDRKVEENREFVEFELVSAMDISQVRLPRRQAIADICQWKYRGPECTYTGSFYFDENDNRVYDPALDVCGKTLKSCKLRFGVPWNGIKDGYVAVNQPYIWCNTDGLTPGMYVQGWGLPGGVAYVTAVGNGFVTLDRNASASSSVSLTATAASTFPGVTAAATPTGVAVGHVMVDGTYFPKYTSVTQVTGNDIHTGDWMSRGGAAVGWMEGHVITDPGDPNGNYFRTRNASAQVGDYLADGPLPSTLKLNNLTTQVFWRITDKRQVQFADGSWNSNPGWDPNSAPAKGTMNGKWWPSNGNVSLFESTSNLGNIGDYVRMPGGRFSPLSVAYNISTPFYKIAAKTPITTQQAVNVPNPSWNPATATATGSMSGKWYPASGNTSLFESTSDLGKVGQYVRIQSGFASAPPVGVTTPIYKIVSKATTGSAYRYSIQLEQNANWRVNNSNYTSTWTLSILENNGTTTIVSAAAYRYSIVCDQVQDWRVNNGDYTTAWDITVIDQADGPILTTGQNYIVYKFVCDQRESYKVPATNPYWAFQTGNPDSYNRPVSVRVTPPPGSIFPATYNFYAPSYKYQFSYGLVSALPFGGFPSLADIAL